jgi:NADH:ubiquinone oxidoreductase subunit K
MTGTALFPLYANINIYLFIGLFLLACGIIGVVYRRSLVSMLIAIELIMNGAGRPFVVYKKFLSPGQPTGMVFTLFIMGIAAAEAAVALAIIILIFRRTRNVESDNLKEMKD